MQFLFFFEDIFEWFYFWIFKVAFSSILLPNLFLDFFSLDNFFFFNSSREYFSLSNSSSSSFSIILDTNSLSLPLLCFNVSSNNKVLKLYLLGIFLPLINTWCWLFSIFHVLHYNLLLWSRLRILDFKCLYMPIL